jgi:hypothetical protein
VTTRTGELSRTAAALLLAGGAAALGWWPADAVAQGCAMCRTALDGQNDPLTQAFNTSVLFLMAMPYLIVGTVGGWFYLAARRRDRDETQGETAAEDEAPDPAAGR